MKLNTNENYIMQRQEQTNTEKKPPECAEKQSRDTKWGKFVDEEAEEDMLWYLYTEPLDEEDWAALEECVSR